MRCRIVTDYCVGNDAPTVQNRYVMGLKKTRAFLIERGHSSTVRYK
jgi:hypothetical protein